MRHLDVSEVSLTCTSRTMGDAVSVNTTSVVVPDPDRRYDVSMGGEHLSFTAREAFEALARLLGSED